MDSQGLKNSSKMSMFFRDLGAERKIDVCPEFGRLIFC